MFTDTFWAVLGISVSVIFGVVGIYLTVRSRYSGAITFVNEQSIELFDAIGGSLEGLAITYNGSDVNDNLVLLNGAFINSGKSDITEDMVEEPITMILPEGFKWLSCRVIESKVKAQSCLVDDHSLAIETGLFRRGESVRFHALAQLPDNKDGDTSSEALTNSIIFNHRITNTQKINEVEVSLEKTNRRDRKIKSHGAVIYLLLIIFVVSFAFFMGKQKSIAYPYQIDDTHIENVVLSNGGGDFVLVTSVSSDFERKEKLQEIFKKINGTPTLIIDESKNKKLLLTYGFMLLVGFWVPGYFFLDFYRKRKWIRQITKI